MKKPLSGCPPLYTNGRTAIVQPDSPALRPRRIFRDFERAAIGQALRESGSVIGGSDGASARLGLKRTTLTYKMKKLGISRANSQSHLPSFAAAEKSSWWLAGSSRNEGAA